MCVQRDFDPELLRKEHEANALPFSLSPFPVPGEGEEPTQVRSDVVVLPTNIHLFFPLQELKEGELRVVAPADVPWIGTYRSCSRSHVDDALVRSTDLLRDIAMTTAFASLT